MTSVLGRYWIGQILIGFVAALFLLVGLDVVFAMIEELGRVGRGSYGVLSALGFVALTLPGRIYEMLPLAALLGALLWLGNLAARGEVVAMAAAGVSRMRMLGWTMQAGTILLLGMLLLGEFVAPQTEIRAQNLRSFALSEEVSFGQVGLWARDEQRVVQIRAVLPGPRLRGVRIFEWDAERGRLVAVTSIAEAEWDAASERWIARDLRTTRMGEDRIRTDTVAERHEAELIPRNALAILGTDLKLMGIRDLWQFLGYLDSNRLERDTAAVAFWGRIFYPLAIFVMLALALGFLFGSQRDGGAGRRLFIGVLVGLGFSIVWRLSAHLGVVIGVAPWLAAAIPHVAFAVLAWGLLRRAGRG